MDTSLSCSSAWHKYQLDLEQKKKRCDEGHSDMKKKGCGWRNSEPEEKETGIVNWHWLPHCFSRSVSRKGRKFSWDEHPCEVVKSNAMHKACKEKTVEMTELASSWQTSFLSRKTE